MKSKIIVGGSGPAALNFCRMLLKYLKQPRELEKLEKFVPYHTFQQLKALIPKIESQFQKSNSSSPKITLLTNSQIGGKSVNHYGEGNQFIAVWGEHYDEFLPFDMQVQDFAQPSTITKIGWSLHELEFLYDSPYRAIDHESQLKFLYESIKNDVEIIQNTQITKIITPKNKKDLVKVQTNDCEYDCDLFIDAMGYNSILNQEYGLNEHSPVYQMLIWKFPAIDNLDLTKDWIVYRPKEFYQNHDVNDHVLGWIHPEHDGIIIGASIYYNKPRSWDEIEKTLSPYLEEYIKINDFIPQGEKSIHHELGVLYNPHHKLNVPNVLQVGDCAKITRPTTGYGWVPAFWHSLYQSLGVLTDDLKLGKKLFNSHFMYNYSWIYVCQCLFVDTPWDPNVEFVFDTANDLIDLLGTEFIDHLTLTQFTKKDLDVGIKIFLKTIKKSKKRIKSIPLRTWKDIIKYGLTNRWLARKIID